jgi:adenylate kinase family enzyme
VGIFMRALMGLIKDRHGTYYARRKVPERLQEAVARILDSGKAKQMWLKKSLGTKVLAEANVRAKLVLLEFDRTLAQAEAQLKERPLRTSLSAVEIKRMAEYLYALVLGRQDKFVQEGPEIEVENRKFTELEEGPQEWAEPIPKFGLSGGQMFDAAETLPELISGAEAALARGGIEHVTHLIEDTLAAFQTNLDANCGDYRKAGMEILRAYVRALRAVSAHFYVAVRAEKQRLDRFFRGHVGLWERANVSHALLLLASMAVV